MRGNDNNMPANEAKIWDMTWCKKARVSTWPIFYFAELVAPIKTRIVPHQQLAAKVPLACVIQNRRLMIEPLPFTLQALQGFYGHKGLSDLIFSNVVVKNT